MQRVFPLHLLALLLCACGMEDDDRCGDDYVFVNNTCVAPADSETADTDSGPVLDTSIDMDGFGLACVDHGDCEGHEADYCAMMPGETTGGCLVSNCTPSPDDCPYPLRCCAFPETLGMPSLCLPQEQYDTYASFCAGGK